MTRSKSVEQMMEHVMERNYDFDLTYITERIISVFFLPNLEEQQYNRNLQEVASMLKSKHQDKFLVSGIVLTICMIIGGGFLLIFLKVLLSFQWLCKNRFVTSSYVFLSFTATKFIRKETWHHQT